MSTSSNGNIFRVTGRLWREFTGHRWIPLKMPVVRSFDVLFDLYGFAPEQTIVQTIETSVIWDAVVALIMASL